MNDNLPKHIKQDLDSGFVMTDIDDGYQRCLSISETTFLYRSDVDGDVFELKVDIDTINQEAAISGYYDSIEDMVAEFGQPSTNMLIAECFFENECPMSTLS